MKANLRQVHDLHLKIIGDLIVQVGLNRFQRACLESLPEVQEDPLFLHQRVFCSRARKTANAPARTVAETKWDQRMRIALNLEIAPTKYTYLISCSLSLG